MRYPGYDSQLCIGISLLINYPYTAAEHSGWTMDIDFIKYCNNTLMIFPIQSNLSKGPDNMRLYAIDGYPKLVWGVKRVSRSTSKAQAFSSTRLVHST